MICFGNQDTYPLGKHLKKNKFDIIITCRLMLNKHAAQHALTSHIHQTPDKKSGSH
jgi:hypothetical protein